MSNRIIQRHDKAANWELYNPVLAEGELGFITDQKNRYKIGDGITAWKDLPLQGFNGNIVNETGDDEGSVMSQKGVTQKLTELESKTDTFVRSKNFVIQKNGVAQSGVERDNLLNDFEGFFDHVEVVNFSGEIGMRFLMVTNNLVEVHVNLFEDKTSKQIATSNASYSIADLIANNYRMNIPVEYKSYGIVIVFNKSISDYAANMPEGSNYRIEGISYADARYIDTGFLNKRDITTDVFNLGYSQLYKYLDKDAVININSMFKKIDIEKGYMGRVYFVERNGNTINMRFDIAPYSDDRVLNNPNAVYATTTIDQEGIINIPIMQGVTRIGNVIFDTRYMPKETAYSTSVNQLATFASIGSQTITLTGRISEKGYFAEDGSVVVDSNAIRTIIPLSEGCKSILVRGQFDSKGNAAILDKDGCLIEWLWKDTNGRKYSGAESQRTLFANLNGKERFVAVSSSNPVQYISVDVEGYDKDNAVDSFNAAKIAKNGQYAVNNFLVSQRDGELWVASERPLQSLPMMKLEEQFEDVTFNGITLKYNSLCDIDSEGNMYFIGHKEENIDSPMMWKKTKSGEKILLFYSLWDENCKLRNGQGNIVELPSEYDEYGWLTPFWQSNYTSNGIKCLPDGELLIWLLGNKMSDDNFKITILAKTTGGQTGLSIKFVFSNEHYTLSNGRTNSVNGYIAPNNGIDIIRHEGRILVAITEYGGGTPKYWNDQGIQKNGNGIVGKTWLSIDGGDSFSKIFDFDEKKNGVASDESDSNWRWAKSKVGRMGVHMHGCKFDQYAKKLFWINGDYGNTDTDDNLFYAAIDDLIAWCVDNKNRTNPLDLSPKYKDNEVLPSSTIVYQYILPKTTFVGERVYYQPWSMIAIPNALLFGHDTIRQTISGITHDRMTTTKGKAMNDLSVSLFAELDKSHPSTTINGIVENMFIRDANSPVLAYHTMKGIYASFNGVDWKLVFEDYTNENMCFLGYIRADNEGNIYICKPGNVSRSQGRYFKVINW